MAWDEPGAGRSSRVPADFGDPALPGLFAGDPPAGLVPLLEGMSADVRPESFRVALLAGHLSNVERPEAFNDAVRAFCGTHSPPPT